MDIIGGRSFVEIPGDRTHELPPLLVRTSANVKRLDRVMGMANEIIESEDLIADAARSSDTELDADRRRMDLAINLVEHYLGFVTAWQWGDSIVEWIRQCETTFELKGALRNVLRPDIWPHAGRSSFVTLLEDKAIDTDGVEIDKAVGLRLTFRQPPPIACFSDQFLFLLNTTIAASAYQKWAHMMPAPISSLPPERFSFQIYNV